MSMRYSQRYESCDLSFIAGQISYTSSHTSASPYTSPFYDRPGAGAAQSSPFVPPTPLFASTPSPYAHNIPLPRGSPRLSDPPPYQRTNSESFGGIGGQAGTYRDHFYNTRSPLYNSYQQNQQQLQINPWLTEYAQAGYLWFDLSMAAFNPIRVDNMGMQTQLGLNELSGPATHPHIQRMTIICDELPCWPITVIGDGIRGLSLGDVLRRLYRMMMWRISEGEWQRLPEGDRVAVARAFARRCRALGNPDLEYAEKQDGVKRVDLLLGKTMFRGLAVEGGIFKVILS